MKTSEFLKLTKEILAKPENWTQEVFSRDKEGKQTHGQTPKSTCFCLYGAIKAVEHAGLYRGSARSSAVDRINSTINKGKLEGRQIGLLEWNDDPARTHQEVLATLAESITSAENNEST